MLTQLDLGINLDEIPPNPRSNTGLNSQPAAYTGLSLGIDALTFLWTGDTNLLDLTQQMLDVAFDFSTATERKIGILWNRVYRGTLGCLYMQRETANGVSHRLSLSGSAVSRVSGALLHRYAQMVHENQSVRCSRIDIRCDDYGDRLKFADIDAACEAENHSGFHEGSLIKGYKKGGWTFQLGSRESEHFVRIYDKDVESKGETNCIRFESEFKGKKAEYIFKQIAQEHCYTPDTIAKWVLGKYDFIDKQDRNLDRNNRLDWWQKFVDDLATISQVAIVERVKSSVESKLHWVRRQVSKSLALIDRAIGSDSFAETLDDLLEYGRSKLRDYDNLLVAEYLVCHNMS
jgi:Replication initiation factor